MLGKNTKCVITLRPTRERVGTLKHNDLHGCPQPLVTNSEDFNELRVIRINCSSQQNLPGQLRNACSCPGLNAEIKPSHLRVLRRKPCNDLTVLTNKTATCLKCGQNRWRSAVHTHGTGSDLSLSRCRVMHMLNNKGTRTDETPHRLTNRAHRSG